MLHLQVLGSGPTLILLHGFCESMPVWEPLVPALSKKMTVVRVDIPGFGLSDGLSSSLGMDGLAAMILDSVKHYGPFVLCGHSMGGYLGLAMLKQNPSAFSGLQLMHSTALADSEERKETRNKTISFIETHGKEAFLENFVPNLFHHKRKELLEEAFALCRMTSESSMTTMTAIMRDRPDRTELLKSSPCPIGWIAGKQDALIPLSSIIDQINLPADSHSVLIDSCGHMGMYEQPDRTAAAILSFSHYCQSISSVTR